MTSKNEKRLYAPRRAVVTAAFLAARTALLGAGAGGADVLSGASGPRAEALAGARTAFADDAEAAFGDPVALGGLTSPELAVSHIRGAEDVRRQSLTAVLPAGRAGTASVSYRFLDAGSFPGFDSQGSMTGDLESSASVFAAGWGRSFPAASGLGGVAVGADVKRLREDHAGVSGAGWAADVGVTATPWGGPDPLSRFRLGAAVRNAGKGPRFDRGTTPLPAEVSAGLGYSQHRVGDTLTLGVECHRPRRGPGHFSAGAELWMGERAALRAGWDGGRESAARWRAGIGAAAGPIRVDYAWSPSPGGFDDAHLFGLVWRFSAAAWTRGRDPRRAYVERGRRHAEAGRWEDAVLDFHRALQIRPDDPEARRGLRDAGERLEEAP
jgi:hypothetical protein